MGPLYKDRHDAGRRLAEPLQKYAADNPLILGLARGGVIVARPIAEALGAELDVLVVRKVGAPSNPEYGVAAVAPMDICVFDFEAMNALQLHRNSLQPYVNRELAEISRRLSIYRRGMAALTAANRVVILVDDGLATGITAVAAARYVKRLGAKYVVFAAPVCSRPGSSALKDEVEEIVCLHAPEIFFAVGMWFEDFSQAEDEEVVEALAATRRREFMA